MSDIYYLKCKKNKQTNKKTVLSWKLLECFV